MSLGHFILEICSNVWSFLSDRAHKEYIYKFKKGEKTVVDGDVDRGNAYVKKIVDDFAKERVHKYDPYIFEDKTYTWLRIPLIVGFEHLETFVEGLRSIYIENSCELIEKRGKLCVTANLGAGTLYFTVLAWGKLFHIEQLLTIKASVNQCKAKVKFNLDVENGRKARLESLYIEEFKDVEIGIEITGFWYLSWFLSKFFTLMAKLNKIIVRNIAEFEIERYASKSISRYQFPNEDQGVGQSAVDKEGDCLETQNCSTKNDSVVSLNNDWMSTSVLKKALSNLEDENPIMLSTITHSVGNEKNDIKIEIKLKETQSDGSKVENELEQDAWYTNIPLLTDEESVFGNCETANKPDENIQIEIKFSKENVILEDVKSLSSLDLTACCVFFKCDADTLQQMMSNEIQYLPSRHYKGFLKNFLKPNKESEMDTTQFSEELREQFRAFERMSKNKKSLKSFFKQYPNFIALAYSNCKEQKLKVTGPSLELESSKEVKSGRDNNEATEEKDINLIACGDLLQSSEEQSNKSTATDRVKTVESILTWTSESEDIEEPKIHNIGPIIPKPFTQSEFPTSNEILEKKWNMYKSKRVSSKNIKGKVSRSTKKNFNRNKNLAQTNVETDIKNFSSVSRANAHKARANSTCTSIEQLNAIEDQICRHFENPCHVNIPESTFSFTDNETATFSQLTHRRKRSASKLAEEPESLVDMVSNKLKKSGDLDHITKKAETFFKAQNKIRRSAETNSALQSAATSSTTLAISEIVKNFFENNPIDKLVLGQSIPLAISDTNENEVNFSFSSKSDFSYTWNDPLFDLVTLSGKESCDIFDVEKYNLDTKESKVHSKVPQSTKQSVDDTVGLNDSSFSDASESASLNSLNVSDNENPANFRGFIKSVSFEMCKTSTKKDSLLQNETDSAVSSCEKMNECNESLKSEGTVVSEIFDSLQSTSTSNKIASQVPSKLLIIEYKNLYSDSKIDASVSTTSEDNDLGSASNINLTLNTNNIIESLNEVLDVSCVEQAFCKDYKTESKNTDKTSNKERIALLKVNEKDNKVNIQPSSIDGQNMKSSLNSTVDYEESYDKIIMNINRLLLEDSQNEDLAVKECAHQMHGQFTSPFGTGEKIICTDITESANRSYSINFEKRRQESLFDHCCIAPPPPAMENDQLDYIAEQTKRLKAVFEAFTSHPSKCESNPLAQTHNRESTYGQTVADTIDSTGVKTYPNKKDLFMKTQDISCGWITSDQAVQGQRSPRDECKIVDSEGRVPWKTAMQIWGGGAKSLFCTDLASCSN